MSSVGRRRERSSLTHGIDAWLALTAPTKRVLSLRDPTQKMSKSAPDPSSRILLTDSDDEIQRKVKRAVTDGETALAYDPAARPGVSNLLSILAGLDASGRSMQQWADELNTHAKRGATGKVLKEAVTDTVVAAIRPMRQEFERLKADQGHLQAVEQLGASKARQRAAKTMQHVRSIVGLTP